MDKELEQQAIQTFATVPEIYQQAFREAGADFPDELVGEIKKDPNQAISLLESNKNLKSAVINIYKQNKDAILQYIQQNTSMFREGGKFDYLMKLQAGGRLKRRDMFNKASANRGFTRQQARFAYNNARRAGLNRDAAMREVIGQPAIEETTTTVERPTLINEVSAPVGQAVASQENISARPTRNYDNVDFGSFNFSDAFNKARGYGLNEFTWNGNRYTTNLAIPALGPDGKNYSIADTLLQNGNISAPDWWISKQWEPATVLSGNGVNPWPAIHAREINPPLMRKGGKLAKENEVNKKYIKASEKAGAKASKEMSDLKAKHKAELKKVRKGQDGIKNDEKKVFDLINEDRQSNGIFQQHKYGNPNDLTNFWTYERVITPSQDTLIRRFKPTGYTFTMTNSDPTSEIITDSNTGELVAIQKYNDRRKWERENSYHDKANYPKVKLNRKYNF